MIFVILITLGYGYIWSLAFLEQKIATLILPLDASGNKCGVDKNADYPYLFFTTPDDHYLYRTVCVKKCPNGREKVLDCNPNTVIKTCKPNPSPHNP